MPLDLTVLVVHLEDDEYTAEADGGDGVETEDGRCYRRLLRLTFTSCAVDLRLQGDVHAEGTNNDDKGADRLLELQVDSEAKVGSHQQD